MMKRKSRQLGFSLVETMIAVVIMAISAMAVAGLVVYMKNEQKRVRERSLLQRSARAFIHEIFTTERNLPAFPRPANWGQSNYDPYSDVNLAQEKCYTSEGGVLSDPKDPTCFFRIQYFRLVVTDQKYPAHHDIASVPLTRLYFKVSFKANNENKVYYFSRLSSNFLQQ